MFLPSVGCVLAVLTIETSTTRTAPVLTVTPAVALVDVPVVVRLEGARPGQEVTIAATATDRDGDTWRSEAVFRADARGVVDAATQPSLRGTYTSREAMGLFWSLKRQSAAGGAATPSGSPMQDLLVPPEGAAFPRPPSGALEVRLTASNGPATLASAVATRQWTGPRVTMTEVRDQGLVGRLYEPPGTRHPAVLVLGGSEGGIREGYAPVLAGHGYVAFSLAYFRAEGLPNDLVEIPLEYLKQGLDWLRGRPSVDPERVALLGHSRGAELALLLGGAYPRDVAAVVAVAPSSVVWEGAIRDPGKTGLAALKSDRSAWTLAGRPLPFVSKVLTPALASRVAAGERFEAIELMALERADAAAVAAAGIPVEKIDAPVALVSCRSDRMWPATAMGNQVVERLRGKDFPHRIEHWSYDACAHRLPDAWLPTPYGGTLGGTLPGTMRAFGAYWPRVKAFLGATIGP
jgi:dienelactone hydrolase